MLEWLEEYQLNLIFRIIVAGACGLLLGMERQKRSKQAGVRTHCVVACASALMMILSKYAYADLIEMYGDFVKLDPSRVAAGVVSGIGFLGAGMIMTHRTTISGLTTAAGVWATSGIGMAIGGGMYIVGICVTVILLIVQLVLHGRRFSPEAYRSRVLRIYDVKDEEFPDTVRADMQKLGVHVVDVTMDKTAENQFQFFFHLEMPGDVNVAKLVSGYPYRCQLDLIK